VRRHLLRERDVAARNAAGVALEAAEPAHDATLDPLGTVDVVKDDFRRGLHKRTAAKKGPVGMC
jgi:hypothetical protein